MTDRVKKSLAELMIASKFLVVGLTATAIHMSMVWLLMEKFSQPPFLANLGAFMTAFVFSFLGHYHWSFKTHTRQANSLQRFFLVAASALLLNNILLVFLLEKAYFSELITTILSVLIIPVYSFIGSRFWAFK